MNKKMKDYVGETIERLTILGVRRKNNKTVFDCKCSCGKYCVSNAYNVTHGKTVSCGCYTAEKLSERRRSLNTIKPNDTFERLTVKYEWFNGKRTMYHCVCICGNETDVCGHELKSGHTQSCGCYSRESRPVAKIKDKRFGMLVAKEYVGNSKWKCKCDCGNETVVYTNNLKTKNTQSCGCFSLTHSGSFAENEIISFIKTIDNSLNVEHHNTSVLGRKEIDIYIPELKIGIEYCGCAFHASEGAVFENKDKYYHRDKYLLARKNGVRLITIFDIDWETKRDHIETVLKESLLCANKEYVDRYVITDNDLGIDLSYYGYMDIEQVEPESFIYKGFTVYRCGKTKWEKMY